MTHMTTTVIPAIGEAFGGGFFAGIYLEYGVPHALIVAPKAEGEAENLEWGDYGKETAARSLIDGLANTRAIADDNHPAAKFCADLRIGGFDDWHLPALDQMTVLRSNLMPAAGYVPAQTTAEAFQEGGPEAFETDDWYWSCTEFGPGSAWLQDFYGGTQSGDGKDLRPWVRAVRKCPI